MAGPAGISGAKLRGKLGALGPLMEQAVDVLEMAGEVRVEEIEYRGQAGHKYFSR